MLLGENNWTAETIAGALARNVKGKEVTEMKIVELCGSGHCPVVKIADNHVEIGEENNVCVLNTSEWEMLKQKILDKEV